MCKFRLLLIQIDWPAISTYNSTCITCMPILHILHTNRHSPHIYSVLLFKYMLVNTQCYVCDIQSRFHELLVNFPNMHFPRLQNTINLPCVARDPCNYVLNSKKLPPPALNLNVILFYLIVR